MTESADDPTMAAVSATPDEVTEALARAGLGGVVTARAADDHHPPSHRAPRSKMTITLRSAAGGDRPARCAEVPVMIGH